VTGMPTVALEARAAQSPPMTRETSATDNQTGHLINLAGNEEVTILANDSSLLG
jgi:hypothetical protein